MFHKIFVTLTIVMLIGGILSSIQLSKTINKYQIEKNKELYNNDVQSLSKELFNILNNAKMETTLASILNENYPSREQFDRFSKIDVKLPGVRNIVLLEYVLNNNFPIVEKDIFNIYNKNITIRPVPTNETMPKNEIGLDSWVIYYSFPFDEKIVGIDLNTLGSLRESLDNVVIEKRIQIVNDLRMIDGNIGMATFQPIKSIYNNVSILSMVRRYKDLFNGPMEQFINTHSGSIIKILYEENVVYDSSTFLNNNIPKHESKKNDIVFDITNDTSIVVQEIDFKEHTIVGELIITFGTIITLLLTCIILVVDCYRSKSTKRMRETNQFISIVSHESKTKMNGILGMCEIILQEEILRPNTENNIKIIRACGKTLMRTINDTIDDSLIKIGKLKINKTLIDIKETLLDVIDDTWDSYTTDSQDSEKNISIILKIQKDTPLEILSDRKRLGQILCNILLNSLKFTKEGNVRIIINKNRIKDKEYIEIVIIDTGMGMNTKKLYQSYENYDSNGMEIGIKISSNIAKHLGHELKYESIEGLGTKCTILIPNNSEKQEKMKELFVKSYTKKGNYTEVINSDGYSGEENDKIVLIVDDVALNRTILKRHVENLGIQTETSCNGMDALEKCKEKKYSIIMMDISMPVMNGIDSLELIQKESLNQNTPSVFISAESYKGVQKTRQRFPETEFMIKPVSADEIKRYIYNIIPACRMDSIETILDGIQTSV